MIDYFLNIENQESKNGSKFENETFSTKSETEITDDRLSKIKKKKYKRVNLKNYCFLDFRNEVEVLSAKIEDLYIDRSNFEYFMDKIKQGKKCN